MSESNQFIKTKLSEINPKRSHLSPEISENIINNSVKSFKFDGDPDNITAIFDSTLTFNGKEGILFTGERLIYKASFSEPICVRYDEINSIETIKTKKENPKQDKKQDKEQDITSKNLKILLNLETTEPVTINIITGCNMPLLAELIRSLAYEFQEHHESAQHIPLESMPEEVKQYYLKIIINMAFDDDGEVDEKELSEILLLMTRLDLAQETRFSVRSYMAGEKELDEPDELIKNLNDKIPPGTQKEIHISLVKDLISIHLSTSNSPIEEFNFLNENKKHLDVDDDEISVAQEAIENDRKMLKGEINDDQFAKALKDIGARAAGIGMPLAAVYLSGSAVGVSAVGLSSGLATIGMGGILGLSSMASGIGVAVLLGVSTYAGLKKLADKDKNSSSKMRQMMLAEIIKNTQTTISLLMEDINYIVERLNTIKSKSDGQDTKIKKLTSALHQLTNAGHKLNVKNENAERDAAISKCPKILDHSRLTQMTRQPTKQRIGEFITSCYEIVETQPDEGGQNFYLKDNLQTRTLKELAEAFESIGYFSISGMASGASKDFKDKAANKLGGFFDGRGRNE